MTAHMIVSANDQIDPVRIGIIASHSTQLVA
jgi:hypothetical protein